MTNPQPEKTRILVAEDTEVISTLMVELLRENGYVVELACDGEECLQKAHSFSPDLILLDLMMPKIHGQEVLRRLKEDDRTQKIEVIVCTAKTYKQDLDQVRSFGVYDIVAKPFDPKELLHVVARHLALMKENQANQSLSQTADSYQPAISLDRCFYQFWGTRGSIPVSGPRYVRHGGNTACLEVGDSKTSVVIDAGSGIRDLGHKLTQKGPHKIYLFISHTHWDHIQGFPFFAPAYLPGYELIIYGVPVSTNGKDLRSLFRGQLDVDYFPVNFEAMKAHIEFRSLAEKVVNIGGLEISWEYTIHPATTVAFCVKMHGRKLAYLSDNEFLYGYLGSPAEINLHSPIIQPSNNLLHLLMDADLLLSEAQYTNEEYPAKIGWGHTSLSNACCLATLTRAKRWVITHHDPAHDDDFLAQKLNLTREILRSLNNPIEVFHAYDGLLEFF